MGSTATPSDHLVRGLRIHMWNDEGRDSAYDVMGARRTDGMRGPFESIPRLRFTIMEHTHGCNYLRKHPAFLGQTQSWEKEARTQSQQTGAGSRQAGSQEALEASRRKTPRASEPVEPHPNRRLSLCPYWKPSARQLR